MSTGLVWHELFAWHNTGNLALYMPYGFPVQPGAHIESPETKRRLRSLLEASGIVKRLVAIEAREEEILRVHSREYLERVRAHDDDLAWESGSGAVMGRGSFRIARLAAGACIEAVEAVLDGTVRNAYALVRPPGHHALRDQGMGFCILANAAIAGMHALEVRGLRRIAFVDWDVHHGNGTQAAFYADPRALTISLHQDRNYPPDTGSLGERGEGPGRGCNINVPLPPGCGNGAYTAAFERIVVPALERFRPELVIVPCGFDGGGFDPLGRMMLSGTAYRALTRMLMEAAEDSCAGRLVMTHEGGYCPASVPFFGLAVIETLAGISTGIEDPFSRDLDALGQQELQPHQELAIRAAEALLEELP